LGRRWARARWWGGCGRHPPPPSPSWGASPPCPCPPPCCAPADDPMRHPFAGHHGIRNAVWQGRQGYVALEVRCLLREAAGARDRASLPAPLPLERWRRKPHPARGSTCVPRACPPLHRPLARRWQGRQGWQGWQGDHEQEGAPDPVLPCGSAGAPTYAGVGGGEADPSQIVICSVGARGSPTALAPPLDAAAHLLPHCHVV
jgi:hypothetical protein